MARLLLPTQMNRLIAQHNGRTEGTSNSSQMANELLDCLGWRRSDEVRKTPLASCLNAFGEPSLTAGGQVSGNDLRIVVESFCKDILDVIVMQLGYTEEQVWDVIEERAPDYRPASRPRSWNDEVGRLTIGQAMILLPALGPLAFPTQTSKLMELVGALRTLSPYFNSESHYQETQPATTLSSRNIIGEVRKLLDRARDCLGTC